LIARYDYPANWPSLLPDICNYLKNQSGGDYEKSIFTGLYSLYALTKKYEYEVDFTDREPLFQIIDYTISDLGNLVNQVLQQQGSELAEKVIYLVCKVIYTSN
jgi:hypothetical protein